MSRVSNLQSIRLNYFNSWNCDWYEQSHIGIMMAKDLRVRCYISGIFKRLKSVASNIYVKQTVSFSYYTFDLFIEEPIMRSKYKTLFYEINKYYSFCFYFYYSYFQYFYLKRKQISMVDSVHMSANSALDSNLKCISFKQHKLHNTDYKKIILSKFLFGKKKREIWKTYNSYFKQLFSVYEEEVLDFDTKRLMYSHLNFLKKNKYSLIQDWMLQSSIITKNTNYIFNKNMTLFFMLFFLHAKPNFVFSKVNISFFQQFFNFSFHGSNFYYLFSSTTINSNALFFARPFKNNQTNFYCFWKKITYIFFSLFFRVSHFCFFNNYITSFKMLNKFKTNNNKPSFISKLIHFKSKRYLKRIRMFKRTKYIFLNKTYLKKYFLFFFNFFFKEMEQTVNYYFYKKNSKLHNILINCNLFIRNFNEFPAIKDAKFICDYVSLGLNNKLSVNKIFYKIRDLQFKNYYFKNFFKKKYKDVEALNHLFDLISEKKYPILGIRIECSGSYKPGSRKKKKYYGEVVKDVEFVHKSPNNSIYADLDFHQSYSRLKSGSIGIKVWVFFKTDLYNNNKHYISLVTSS